MFDKSEKAKKTEEEVKLDELENKDKIEELEDKDKAEEEARDEELKREEEENKEEEQEEQEDEGGLAGFNEFKEGEELDQEEESGGEETEPASEHELVQRTPNEVSTDSPEESAKRYGLDTSVTEGDHDNPRVDYLKTEAKQVPAGTHLHPDIVKDTMNKGISQHTTDSAQVMRNVTVGYDFADDAEHNDKC